MQEGLDFVCNTFDSVCNLIDTALDERIKDARLKYLPVALALLKADFPDLYLLIIEYYYAETKTTMADLGKRHGLTTETVRYRIKSAKEKLKLYIIMHENKE